MAHRSIKKPMSFMDSMTVRANTATVVRKTKRLADPISHRKGEYDAKRARNQRRTRLENFVDFACNIETLDDPPQQIREKQAAKQCGQDRDEIKFGIAAVESNCG